MSEGERRLVPVLAALQPRSEPDRNGILQTQGPYARRKGQNLRRAPEGHRRYLRPLRARRMLELFQCRRLCVRLNARCSSKPITFENCLISGALMPRAGAALFPSERMIHDCGQLVELRSPTE